MHVRRIHALQAAELAAVETQLKDVIRPASTRQLRVGSGALHSGVRARAFEVLEHLATMGGLTSSEDPGAFDFAQPFDFAQGRQGERDPLHPTAFEAEQTRLVAALARHLDPPAR